MLPLKTPDLEKVDTNTFEEKSIDSDIGQADTVSTGKLQLYDTSSSGHGSTEDIDVLISKSIDSDIKHRNSAPTNNFPLHQASLSDETNIIIGDIPTGVENTSLFGTTHRLERNSNNCVVETDLEHTSSSSEKCLPLYEASSSGRDSVVIASLPDETHHKAAVEKDALLSKSIDSPRSRLTTRDSGYDSAVSELVSMDNFSQYEANLSGHALECFKALPDETQNEMEVTTGDLWPKSEDPLESNIVESAEKPGEEDSQPIESNQEYEYTYSTDEEDDDEEEFLGIIVCLTGPWYEFRKEESKSEVPNSLYWALQEKTTWETFQSLLETSVGPSIVNESMKKLGFFVALLNLVFSAIVHTAHMVHDGKNDELAITSTCRVGTTQTKPKNFPPGEMPNFESWKDLLANIWVRCQIDEDGMISVSIPQWVKMLPHHRVEYISKVYQDKLEEAISRLGFGIDGVRKDDVKNERGWGNVSWLWTR